MAGDVKNLEESILAVLRPWLSGRKGKEKRTAFLDYDGTLAPFASFPHEAHLSPQSVSFLRDLVSRGGWRAVIVTSRDRWFLERELQDLPLDLAAEYGNLFREYGESQWREMSHPDLEMCTAGVAEAVKALTAEIPGSFVEKKEYGITWHYRHAPAAADHVVTRIIHSLRTLLPAHLTVGRAPKAIEIRPAVFGKGEFVESFLAQCSPDTAGGLLVAVGDDIPDEEMFRVVKQHGGLAVKVGEGETAAQVRVPHPEEVSRFFQLLDHELSSD